MSICDLHSSEREQSLLYTSRRHRTKPSCIHTVYHSLSGFIDQMFKMVNNVDQRSSVSQRRKERMLFCRANDTTTEGNTVYRTAFKLDTCRHTETFDCSEETSTSFSSS